MLDERADDMAFFEERIEKGVIAKLQGIVDSEFVRMDYTEAIGILQNGARRSSSSRSSGAWICNPSTSATCPRSTSASR